MDIYERLIEDHGKQRGLAGGLAKTEGDSAERRRLFDAFKLEVESHAALEEQVFYAELMSHAEGQEQARHSIIEHDEASTLIEELLELDMASSGWLNKFNKLHHELEHHVEEEEKDVFRLARKLISDKRAREMAEEFDRLKKEAMAA